MIPIFRAKSNERKNRKMQVVIERKDSFDGYVVTCEDGRVFEVETITEAIELKKELQNEN